MLHRMFRFVLPSKKSWVILFGVQILLVGLFVYSNRIVTEPMDRQYSVLNEKDDDDDDNRTLILMWTNVFGTNSTEHIRRGLWQCSNRCRTTSNKNLLSKAKAVVFHMTNFDLLHVPSIRYPNQSYVFFVLEPPPKYGKFLATTGFFNLTMTYRRDSDVTMPYGRFVQRDGSEKPDQVYTQAQVREAVAKKNKLVVWFVSNCWTHSGREVYVKELKKYIDVDQFGFCSVSGIFWWIFGSKTCDKKCETEIIGRYKFVIAMESSVCLDYVTEKFWRLDKLIVPIVLRNSDVAKVAPNGSYIAVDQFRGVKQLAEYLKRLDRDDEAYLRYFEWTKTHRVLPMVWPQWPACDLCDLIRQSNRSSRSWNMDSWDEDGICELHYAQRFI